MTDEKKPDGAAKPATAPATPPKAPAASAGATAPATTAASTTAHAKTAEPAKSDEPTKTASASAEALTAAEAAKKAAADEFEKALLEEDTTEVPTDDELDAVDAALDARGGNIPGLDATQTASVRAVFEKLANMSLDVIQPGTPDSYNLFGYSGINISLGEIRILSRAYRLGQQ